MNNRSWIPVSPRRFAGLLLIIIPMFFGTTQSDIDCLRSIKHSLQDPKNMLSSWRYNHHMCTFPGVECWSGDKIFKINISNMGLRGEFPRGISNCSSLTSLDLSNNHFYGTIPSDISHLIPYVTTLDLSSNTFSGKIPVGIANLSYVNVLNLSNNLLTGRIPAQIVYLQRLRSFTVANNFLSGPVPRHAYSVFSAEVFANNSGLCGEPLDPCEPVQKTPFIGGFAVGWTVFAVLSFIFGLYVPLERYIIKFKNREWMRTLGSQSLPSNGRINDTIVSTMEKFCSKISYHELEKATDNFSHKNIVARGKTGITYKAVLQSNGWVLAIKRFHPIFHIETMFQYEIRTLGRLRHKNLVPLIGFCYESDKRFLIYKFMPNGSLHHWLFSPTFEYNKLMDWPLRVKIAVGIAEGVVWLHQNRVVHGGISSKCILLDGNFNPKISGMKIENVGLDSYEIDVYGFGTVLFELITGKKHGEMIAKLPNRPRKCVESIREQGFEFDDEISYLLIIVSKCIEFDAGKCPSMLQVYQMLMEREGYVLQDGEIEFAE